MTLKDFKNKYDTKKKRERFFKDNLVIEKLDNRCECYFDFDDMTYCIVSKTEKNIITTFIKDFEDELNNKTL